MKTRGDLQKYWFPVTQTFCYIGFKIQQKQIHTPPYTYTYIHHLLYMYVSVSPFSSKQRPFIIYRIILVEAILYDTTVAKVQ